MHISISRCLTNCLIKKKFHVDSQLLYNCGFTASFLEVIASTSFVWQKRGKLIMASLWIFLWRLPHTWRFYLEIIRIRRYGAPFAYWKASEYWKTLSDFKSLWTLRQMNNWIINTKSIKLLEVHPWLCRKLMGWQMLIWLQSVNQYRWPWALLGL